MFREEYPAAINEVYQQIESKVISFLLSDKGKRFKYDNHLLLGLFLLFNNPIE